MYKRQVQQAWDKQANFLSAQARAQKTLDSMINRYEELLHKNWKLATKEQKARIAVLKSKITSETVETEAQISAYMDKLEGVMKNGSE